MIERREDKSYSERKRSQEITEQVPQQNRAKRDPGPIFPHDSDPSQHLADRLPANRRQNEKIC